MTQEEKQLLFVDLCVRLPYGVIADFKLGQLTRMKQVVEGWWLDKINDESFKFIKPYLRPLSSMTEEELKELTLTTGLQHNQLELVDWGNGHKTLEFYLSEIPQYCVIKIFDWLNAHHFDYRELIEKGLALEASKGMYKTE